MSIISLDKGRALGAAVASVTWRSLQVAAAIAVVVVPFGYAITDVNDDVLMGALAGLTVGIGLNLRMGARNGRSVGILIGTTVGAVTALIAGLIPGNPWGALITPVLALGIGLTDGLGETRIRGYRDALQEAALLSGLLGAGLLFVPGGFIGTLGCVFMIGPNALYVGIFNRNHEGRRYSRPPIGLLFAWVAVLALVTYLVMHETEPHGSLDASLLSAFSALVVVPIPTFLAARTFAIWIEPRLRLYVQLADYLRVMWVPIGGFAVGYLAIIVIFSGFFGMLERFVPESFNGAAGAGVSGLDRLLLLLGHCRPQLGDPGDFRAGPLPGRNPARLFHRLGARGVRRGDVRHPAATGRDLPPQRGKRRLLTACGKTPAAQFSRWGLKRRCIPSEPRRRAALIVAFRSKYTRYSSLTRLVSRAPRHSRRSRGFHHRLLTQ